MKETEQYNWVQFSQSFLHIAHLSCQEMLERKHVKVNLFSKNTIPFYFQDLFLPTIFNIKHGIEIFIKTINIIISDTFKSGHNSYNLFVKIKNEIKKHNISKLINKKYKSTPNDTNLKLANDDVKNLDSILDDTEKLILKYYHCDILKDKLGQNFQIKDIDNTAFRYPENTIKIKINYNKFLQNINKTDIEQILEDIKKLEDNFNRLGFILDIYKQHIRINKNNSLF